MLKRAGLALLTMLLGPPVPVLAEPASEGAPAAAPVPPPSDFVKMNGEPNLPQGADPNAPPPPKKPKPPKKPPPPSEPKPLAPQ